LVTSAPVSDGANEPRIGERLRKARKAQRLTLDQLSVASGLTKGFLSRLERDQSTASVGALIRLCNALNIPIGALFDESPADQVVKADSYPRVNFGGSDLTEFLLTPPHEHRIQAIISEISPKGGSGSEMYSLPADVEWVFVLEGRLHIEWPDREVILEPGDAMTLDPTEAHRFTGVAEDEQTKVLWVISPALPKSR
jgi:transcriptional regulator with XRE-family HTH domain